MLGFLGLNSLNLGLDLAEGPDDLLVNIGVGPELANLLFLLILLQLGRFQNLLSFLLLLDFAQTEGFIQAFDL